MFSVDGSGQIVICNMYLSGVATATTRDSRSASLKSYYHSVCRLVVLADSATRGQVELLRNLHHPNIVGYKDSFLTPRKDHLCIVMEYCDGGDLSTQIKNAR